MRRRRRQRPRCAGARVRGHQAAMPGGTRWHRCSRGGWSVANHVVRDRSCRTLPPWSTADGKSLYSSEDDDAVLIAHLARHGLPGAPYTAGAGQRLSPTIRRSRPLGQGMGRLAWHSELEPAGDTTVVFRDSAFADDVAETNLTATLVQGRLANVRGSVAVQQWPASNRETSRRRYERRFNGPDHFPRHWRPGGSRCYGSVRDH